MSLWATSMRHNAMFSLSTGERVAEVTHARSVDDTTLVVEVRSSAWLMELNMMKGDLLKRVNEHASETPMDRLVFVLAETE